MMPELTPIGSRSRSTGYKHQNVKKFALDSQLGVVHKLCLQDEVGRSP